MTKEDLSKFIRDVAKSCPIDTKKLQSEIVKAKGKKELAFQAVEKAGTKPATTQAK